MEKIVYQFVDGEDGSFRLIGEDGKEASYRLQKNIGTWTVGQGLGILSKSARSLSEMAGNVFNFLLSTLKGVPDNASMAEVIRGFLLGLFGQGTEGLGKELIISFAEVLEFINREKLIAHMTAVCYLKNNEFALDEEELARRIDIFNLYTPANLGLRALSHFFPNMSQSPNVTGSLSSTSIPTKNP